MIARPVWRLACAAAFVLLAASAWAQAPRPVAANGSLSVDEQVIRRAVIAFVELYNARNADGLAALFAPDARVTFRDGTEVNGRDELKQAFAKAFAASPKGAVSVVVDSIRFLTPDTAVEEGFTSLFPDGDTLTARSRYTVLHVKKDGRWQMQAVRIVEEESLSAYGELMPLEWLVGEWIDEGRTETVEARFRWDDNKSFLLEEFQVIREGDVVLKGTQRIGWDPQARQIRSWTFDSAGGFGEATWTPVEDRWVCKAKAVTADGTAASATRTLHRAAPGRVIWTATDRLAGNEQLPDLAVTMVRKSPLPQK
ncbi:MAG: nuclear transport factor 2 family protein [Pirellulaceae bacterium]|nr:nuclear transport factor 2 family protein [Pirellulaceae bacterium]